MNGPLSVKIVDQMNAMITPLRAIGMTKDHAHREEESADFLEQKCNREVHDVLADEQSHGQISGESEAAEERRIGQEMEAVVGSDELFSQGTASFYRRRSNKAKEQ